MHDFVNLVSYPINEPESQSYQMLVARCQSDLAAEGMFNLDAFLQPEVSAQTARHLAPRVEREAFAHVRAHNIYFTDRIAGLPEDHPAQRQVETANSTLCGDQIDGTVLNTLYHWAPMSRFLADVMGLPALFPMDDVMSAVNVMSYSAGQALNWHFDRSEFTTTLLLQAPKDGGVFEYRRDLRSETAPNYDGVARLLKGQDPEVRQVSLTPGTLNVFRGRNTAHRVTAVEGDTPRMIAVFSYYQTPGVRFSAEERRGFYGRSD